MNYTDSLTYKYRYLLAGILFLATLVLIFFAALAIDSNMVVVSAEPKDDKSNTYVTKRPQYSDSPNAVTSGFASAQTQLGEFTSATSYRTRTVIKGMASATVDAGNTVGKQTKNITLSAVDVVGGGLKGAGNGVKSVGSFAAQAPGKVFGAAKNTLSVGKFIRPSDHIADTPIIDPNSVELAKALAALPAKASPKSGKATQADTSNPRWPIRGTVTTQFGVPHWPYQSTHSGLDISDGNSPGITPVKAFRSGRVIETISSYSGLGNHVIVDHGNGVTSVYAHLASIAVSVGQKVNTKTTLGLEGTTGASTGTHLHFEVRINGQATDPSQFIDGQP